MITPQGNAKIKVCHVLSDSNIGGAGIALRNLLISYDRERFAFSVILPRGAAIAQALAATDTEIIEIEGIADRSFAPLATGALIRTFRRISPHIVHTHASFSGRLAARAAGVPAIVMTRHCATGHTGSGHSPALTKALSPVAGLLMHQTCTRAIAVGEEARAALTALRFPAERIDIIYNGALPPRNITETEKAAVRQRYDLDADDFVVGIFARLEKCKAHEIFLHAAAICAERSTGMRFLIVGDGSRRAELEELADRLGLRSCVRFCGFCKDTAPLMSVCAVHVNTSVPGEVSSLASIEGMSLGVPQIMSDCVGRGIQLEGCGIATVPGSPDSTARAILQLHSDPDLRLRLSAASKKRFFDNFTERRCAEETEKVYLKALAEAQK